ncbi:MAG: hypothetical protein FJ118_20855, partial [Deltaproteobacteria bacterium]|nr:hypothetical protein [Deltaproteobacteria bacterium]
MARPPHNSGMNLQESINAMPPGGRLELPPGEFFGQVVMNRPVTIVGKGSSTWIGARASPAVKIQSPAVKIENLIIEISSGPDGIAVEADPGTNPILENV